MITRRNPAWDCTRKQPPGWWCSRWKGHPGPCALHPSWWNVKWRYRMRVR